VNILEERQCFGIGQRLNVLYRLLMYNAAYRHFSHFTVTGSGNIGDLNDFGRYVARCGVLTDSCPDSTA